MKCQLNANKTQWFPDETQCLPTFRKSGQRNPKNANEMPIGREIKANGVAITISMIGNHWQLIGIHRSNVIAVHWPSLAINDIMTLALLGFIGKNLGL